MINKTKFKTVEICGSKRLIAAFILGSYMSLLCPFTLTAQENNNVPEKLPVYAVKEEKAEVLISAEKGGSVTLGDASIEIPEGALKQDTVISITKLIEVADTGESLYNAIPKSGGYRFLPAGTKFEKDVTITLPYNPELNSKPQVLDELYTYFYDTEKESWIKLERLEIDKDQCIVHSLSNHFTDMINATLALPESASPVDVNLNSIKNLEATVPDGHLLKFTPPQANNMGNASFSFELGIPTGRKGMQPQISVSFNSDSGNGIMGKGFDVSYGSSITTDTRLKLPSYNTSDSYMLDGISLEEIGRDGNTITYQLQKETSFSRIMRFNAGQSNDYWEVTDKNGTKRFYEQNSTSCVGGGSKTFTWNLTKIEDVNGNNVKYTYIKPDGYVYPDVIYYTGYNGFNGNYEVHFHYGNREDVRVDARSKEIISCTKILTDITTHYKNENAIRTYSFSYKEGLAKEKMLTAITVKNNADESYCYTFDYVEPERSGGHIKYFADSVEWGNGKAIKTGKSDSGNASFSTNTGFGVGDPTRVTDVRLTGGLQGDIGKSESESETVLVDINGDGRPDYVKVNNGKITYRLNNLTGFSDTEQTIETEEFQLDKENSRSNSFGWSIYGGAGLNAPYAPGLGVTYSSVTQENFSEVTTSFMDIDADGKVDILLSGKNFYLKNNSDSNSVKFGTTYYDQQNSEIVLNNERNLTEDELKNYKDIYRIHTPFRQWVSQYDGILEVTETLNATDSFKNDANVQALVYKNDTENAESSLSLSISGSKKKDTRTKQININNGESLFFITKTQEPLGADSIWNIDLTYKGVKPYASKISNPEFFPTKIYTAEAYYEQVENEPELPSNEVTIKGCTYVLPEYCSILYDASVEQENLPDDPETNVRKIKRTVTFTLKDNWQEYAAGETEIYKSLVKQNEFLPGAFTEEQFKLLFENLPAPENLEDDNTDDQKLQYYSVFASRFVHDNVSDLYILKDKDEDTYEYFINTLNSVDIIKDSWSNYKLYGLDADFDGAKIIYNTESNAVENNSKRSEENIGTVINKGDTIVLGNIGERFYKVSRSNNKVYNNSYLDENMNVTSYEKDKTLFVEILNKLNNEKIIYTFKDYDEIAKNISDEEMEEIIDSFSYDGSNVSDDYWNKEKIQKNALVSLALDYGMEKNEYEYFIDLVFIETEDEETNKNSYSIKDNLSNADKENANSLLRSIKKRKILEEDFPFYEKTESGFSLKEEYASLADNADTTNCPELLIKKCKEFSLGKYRTVQLKIIYDNDFIYPLIDDTFNSLRISENSINITEESIIVGRIYWASNESWEGEDAKEELVLYAGNNNDAKVELLHNLKQGSDNWFHGIWISGGMDFNGKNLYNLLFSDKTNLKDLYKDKDFMKMSEKEAEEQKGKNEEIPFYIPLRNTTQSGTDIYPMTKESSTEETELEDILIGQIGTSTEKVEKADGSIKMQASYYFAYIKDDYIHSSRSGGNAYYNIEGIRSVSQNYTSFSLPVIRKSENKATDITYGVNKDDSVNTAKDPKDLEDGLHINGSGSVGFGSTKGSNTSEGKLTQTIMDINGDSIPDIIKKNETGINITNGNKINNSISYSGGTNIDRVDINSTSSSLNVEGGSFSTSGSVTLKFTKSGEVVGASTTASVSGGAGSTKVTGDSETNSAFIDLNGDGLPDWYTKDKVFINNGNDFISGSMSMPGNVPLSISEIKTNSYNANEGKSASHSETLTTGVNIGTGLSYSVSTNKTKEMYMDINGDGLPDRLTQESGYISVLYNTGNAFANTQTIYLPDWNSNYLQNDSIIFVKDVDFSLGIFGELPLIGEIAKRFVNSLSAYIPDMNSLINNMDSSSSITLAINGNIGIDFNWFVVYGVSFNMSCSGGNGVSGSSSINFVNTTMTDLDGDGLADHVLRIPGRATYWKRNISGTYGQLRQINLPQGGNVQIEYAEQYSTPDNPNFKYVMSKVIISDGCGDVLPAIDSGNHSVITIYKYKDGYYDRARKDFYGFGTVTTIYSDGTYLIEKYNNSEYYAKGNREYTCFAAKDDTILFESRITLCKAPVALPQKEESWSYEKLNRNEIYTVTSYTYDNYGNCTHVIQDFGNNKRISAEINYKKPNFADYILGLPTDIYVYDSENNLLRHREGIYDNLGQLSELYQYYDRYSYTKNNITYDTYGNILSISDSKGVTLSYIYESTENTFVEEIHQFGKNTEVYKSFIEYDIELQIKKKEKDCNLNTLTYDYDDWQRIVSIKTSYDTETTPAISYSYYTPEKNEGGKHDFWYAITNNKITFDANDNSIIQTVVQIDGLGRGVRTAKTGFVNGIEGWNASGAVEYDSKGRPKKEGMTEFKKGSLQTLLNSTPKMTDLYTVYEYDEKDRKVMTILPDKEIQKMEYEIKDGNLISYSTDPLGNVSVQESDSTGNIVRVAKLDPSGNKLTEVTYQYNEIGEMLKAFDAKGNPISVEYDLLGRRTALESLDSGRQEFYYDDCSNLVRENNSVLRNKNKQIVYEYDNLNRLIKIDYPDTEDTVYTYGGLNDSKAVGKILSISDASGTIEYEYGNLGEVIKETRTLYTHLNRNSSTQTAVMEYRSDYLGRMQWIIYPDGEKITYGYDKGGQVVSVKGKNYNHAFDYVTNILYDEYGQRTKIVYGNGTVTEYKYDPERRWLDSIKTENRNGEMYQNITYTFDAVGNVLKYVNDCLIDRKGIYRTEQKYSYDNLYQLVRVDGNTIYNPHASYVPDYESNYTQVFNFDSEGLGNMTSKISSETVTPQKTIGDNLNYSINYVYDNNYAHRLINAGDRFYQYDENGNIICEQDGSFDNSESEVYRKITQEAEDVYSTDYGWGLVKEDSENAPSVREQYKRTYEWNEKNMLISSVDYKFSTYYVYGQDGQRSNKYTEHNETLYFNKMWTLHTDSGNNNHGGQYAKNIYLGDTRIVTKLNSGENATYQEEYYKQYFYHSDHLGSASMISDYNGDEYQRIEYTPYGETWVEKTENTGNEYLPYKFTGKEIDEETGLYYYGARYLDPKYSRWISTDPALGEYIPQAPVSGEARKHNQNLPGMGGVFNTVNFNLYHYAGNNPIKYTDPDGRIEKPSWILAPDKCESYSYTMQAVDPYTGMPNLITTSRSVEHSRISFSGPFLGHEISFSGTKDVIKNNISGGFAGSEDTISLIRLNVTYDGKNYDYYSLDVENTTRILMINFPPDKSHTTQLVEDLLNDSESLYKGEFYRNNIEDGVALNSALKLATAGFLQIVSTPNALTDNLLNAAVDKLQDTLKIKHNTFGSEDIKKDIEYILP